MLISFYLFINFFYIVLLLTVGVIPFKILSTLINVDVPVNVDVHNYCRSIMKSVIIVMVIIIIIIIIIIIMIMIHNNTNSLMI